MTGWAPWLLAFVVWNGVFDLQVRRASQAFTVAQVQRWQRQEPPELIRDVLTPRVRAASMPATAAAAVALALGLARARRAAPPAYR